MNATRIAAALALWLGLASGAPASLLVGGRPHAMVMVATAGAMNSRPGAPILSGEADDVRDRAGPHGYWLAGRLLGERTSIDSAEAVGTWFGRIDDAGNAIGEPISELWVSGRTWFDAAGRAAASTPPCADRRSIESGERCGRTPVPLPSTLALLGIGALGIGLRSVRGRMNEH